MLFGAYLGGTLGFAASGAGNNPNPVAAIGATLTGTLVGGLIGYTLGRAAQHGSVGARFGIAASIVVATITWGIIAAIAVGNALSHFTCCGDPGVGV